MADTSRIAPADTSRVASDRVGSDGLDAALAICLGAYSFVAGCFALALYALLQPSTSPNPGLDAYNPPPKTIISYVAPTRSKTEPTTDGRAAAAIEPEPILSSPPEQTTKDPAKTEAKKEEATAEARAQANPRRTTARQREHRSPVWDDYAQPYFNNYRPWF
jgi:hypothetical protein